MWHTQRYLRDITLHWEQSVSKVLYVFDEAFQYQWEDWIGTYQKNSNLGKSPTVFFFGSTYLFTARENETTNQLLSSISFLRLFSLPVITTNSIGNILGRHVWKNSFLNFFTRRKKNWKVILRFFNCDMVTRTRHYSLNM